MKTSPSCPTLSSLKHEDIIECLIESIEEKIYHIDEADGCNLDFNQQEWLADVTNDGLDEYGEIDQDPVIKWDNPQSVSFAILNLSAAGQKLNVKKLEEEGIDDYIGTHFPKFKDNPRYSSYPKNYSKKQQKTKMTTNIEEVKRIDPNESVRIPVTLDEFYTDWLTFPNQRDHETKARSKKWQTKMLRPHYDHYEVKGVICGCDIVNPISPTQSYKKGDKIKTDGHTTAEFFAVVCKEIGREDLIPINLNVTHHIVYNWDELQDAFNVFDDQTTAKKGSDRFFGALRVNSLQLFNLSKVESIASLEYAAALCYPTLYVKGKISTPQEANRMMKDVGDAFVWLDEIVSDKQFGNNGWFNPLLKCSYVMSYMLYRHDEDALAKLKQFVINVAGKKVNTQVNDVDSCSFFIQKFEEIHAKRHALTYATHLNRTPITTNTISFTLKMIDDYIKGETRTKMPSCTTIGNYINTWQNKFKSNINWSPLENVLYDAS